MAFETQAWQEGGSKYVIPVLNKGAWTHSSALSTPPGFAPVMTNFDLPGDIPTTMYGNSDFIATAWTGAATKVLGFAERRIAGSTTAYLLFLDDGTAWVWVSSWTQLRSNLATSGWWSWIQYGTDVFVTNTTDGVYRFDGDTLVPIGAKPIAQMESDEAALWAGETAETTNFREGAQSMYVESTGAQVTMTFTPAANFNAVAGRHSAVAYETDKSPGTDFYHFKVMFNNTGTIDTTNTRVLLTDGDGDSLNFPFTVWDSDKDGTAAVTPVAGTWYDIYLPALDGTETATFNAANIDTFAFAVDTSAGTLRMHCDDFYVVYNNTMPNVQYLEEWKNILFGARTTANLDTYFFSKVAAPDEYNTLAKSTLKTKGGIVTGLKKFYNQLVVSTEHSIHSLSGSTQGRTYPTYLFDVQEVTDEGGFSSHRGIVKAGNRLFGLYQREFLAYNGTGVQKVSYPVDVTVALIDDANLDLTVGDRFRAKNEIWWTYRRSGQSANDRILRYNYVLDAWLPTEGLSTPIVHRTFISGAERLLTFDETNRKVKRENDSAVFTFHGTNIAATLELPPLINDTPMEWVEILLQYLTNTGSVTVAYRVAQHLRELAAASYTTLGTINQAVAGELGRILTGDRSPIFQLRLTTAGVRMQLQPPITVYAQGVHGDARYV